MNYTIWNVRNDIRTASNSGHTATVLRTFAQIRLRRTSYVRQTLAEIPHASLGIFKRVSYMNKIEDV